MTKAPLLATTAQPQATPPAPMPKAKVQPATPKVNAQAPARPTGRPRKRRQRRDLRAPAEPDVMVPDPQVALEFGVTLMTLWRWDKDHAMDFPPPIRFSDQPQARKFRSRRALEAFKQRMMERAIATRAKEAV